MCVKFQYDTRNLPDIDKMDFATVPLKTILVEERNEKRRKKKFSKERKKWNGFRSVPGMKRIAQELT